MANEDWAKDPNTRPEVLAMLSTSPSVTVRTLVAHNPATPEPALLHLARDVADEVRRAVAQRTDVSAEVLRTARLPREALPTLTGPLESKPPTALDGGEPVPARPTEIVGPAPTPPGPAWLAWLRRLLGRTA